MQVIITGVAGYIGAHVANCFLESGYEVVGIDNLSTGKEEFLDKRMKFVFGNVQDSDTLDRAMSILVNPQNSAVIHCAGLKFAGESVKRPLEFYENNTFATLKLLEAMNRFEIPKLVFSSSCSVYGNINSYNPVNETHQTLPVSPYGKSKYYAEEIIRDFVNLGKLKAVSLRYFNVAGNGLITAYDLSRFNLFPNLYRAIDNKSELCIFGDDYNTFDGTCVRDYVDVVALSKAHVLAVSKLDNIQENFSIYNLGAGEGFSVKQIFDKAKKSISPELRYVIAPRRKGDPGQIRADVHRAKTELNWENSVSCEQMLISGWEAWNRGKNL